VIDGQHTAIAAASHGGVAEIPVLVVEAPDVAARARSFVGLNRDRVNVTPLQIFRAELAAGDKHARELIAVCERAGARLLFSPPANGLFRAGETAAVSTLRALIKRRGPMKARMVLEVLVKAHCSPISAALMRAAEEVLCGGFAGEVTAERLTLVLRGLANVEPPQVRELMRERRVPHWRALAIHLGKVGGAHERRAA
jgi:hypothetical protein